MKPEKVSYNLRVWRFWIMQIMSIDLQLQIYELDPWYDCEEIWTGSHNIQNSLGYRLG